MFIVNAKDVKRTTDTGDGGDYGSYSLDIEYNDHDRHSKQGHYRTDEERVLAPPPISSSSVDTNANNDKVTSITDKPFLYWWQNRFSSSKNR